MSAKTAKTAKTTRDRRRTTTQAKPTAKAAADPSRSAFHRAGRGKPVLIGGRTLAELGRAIKVTPSYMSRLHLGHRVPSVKVLDKLAAELDLTRDEVLLLFARKGQPAEQTMGAGSSRPTKRVRRTTGRARPARAARRSRQGGRSSRPTSPHPSSEPDSPTPSPQPV